MEESEESINIERSSVEQDETECEIDHEEIEYHDENISQLEDLKNKLEDIDFLPADWPPEKVFRTLFDTFELQDFPNSYKTNTKKEMKVLDFVECFRVQYQNRFNDRKPLFMSPKNECDVQKFVCTTIKPVKLPHREIYSWEGAAKFVSDFLNYVSLTPSTELPGRLLSPMTVLNLQKGSCFEYATLLVSMLLGVGYKAYVVSGYGTREACYMDQKNCQCPLLTKGLDEVLSVVSTERRRYSVKPIKDYTSKFEIEQQTKRIREEQEEKVKADQAEAERIRELEKPLPDKLFGLRIHAWVLVMAGKRDVTESFFIEPSTGERHPLQGQEVYNGLESIWNQHNYWVNMQDCSNGINEVDYNTTNCHFWEQIFPNPFNPESSQLGTNHYQSDDDEEHEEMQRKFRLQEEHRLAILIPEIPTSWTLTIKIDRARFETCYPMSSKTTCYNRAVLERFAPYFLLDGLVTRITTFSDKECRDSLSSTEYFQFRKDKLIRKEINSKTGWVTEFYNPGRTFSLCEHTYKLSSPGVENERTLIFRHNVRVDGLYKREETSTSMTDYFIDRPDRLNYRHTVFTSSKSVNKRFPETDSFTEVSEKTLKTEKSELTTKKEKSECSEYTNKTDLEENRSDNDEYEKTETKNSSFDRLSKRSMRKKSSSSKKSIEFKIDSFVEKLASVKGAHEASLHEGLTMSKTFSACAIESNGDSDILPKPNQTQTPISIQRPIEMIVERFERNPEVTADEDVAERIFFIAENRFKLTYHKSGKNCTASTREYLKPQQIEDQLYRMTLQEETHTAFMVDRSKPSQSKVKVFQLLLDLYNMELEAMDSVRWSENETLNIVKQMNVDENTPNQLEISKFDSLRNDVVKAQRVERDRLYMEENVRNQQLAMDYLSPFMAQIGFASTLTWELACRLREDCLGDFKQRLIKKANLIQDRLNNETKSLQNKQQWYMENRVTMTEDDEEKYVDFCNKAAFLITTLQLMLVRHKQLAPHRYIELENMIKKDPRLSSLNPTEST